RPREAHGADLRFERFPLDGTAGGIAESEMTRRDLFRTAAALPLAATGARGAGSNHVETERIRLRLRHTWTTVMSSSDTRDTIYCRFTAGGVTGGGEGAPIVRYKEDAESARKAIESVRELLTTADPWQFAKLMGEVFHRVKGENAGKAAIDIALMDWV